MINPSTKHRYAPESLFDSSLIMPDSDRKYILRDFFRDYFPEYCRTHQVDDEKRKIMNSLMVCRTGELGYSILTCEECGTTEYYPCSCGSRYCPSCGTLEQMRWIAKQEACLIPGIPYYHLVFTVPHDLNALIYQNQKDVLNILFSSVKNTILTLSMSRNKIIPGILMVLHTFGSNLSLHYHLHVLVSGGGLTADHTFFKKCMSNKFFLPLKAMMRMYRGKFMAGLKELHDSEKLMYFSESEKYRNTYEWHQLLSLCYTQDWNIEIRRFLSPGKGHSAKTFAPYVSRKMISDSQVCSIGKNMSDPEAEEPSSEEAIQYFSNYTHCSAINDSRITGIEDGQISFQYKQYHSKSYEKKTMTLSAEEFIRRYLLHILPKGFQKVRSAGFLSGCVREKNLKLIHELLAVKYTPSKVKDMNSAELILYFFKEDIRKCTACRKKVRKLPEDENPPAE